MAVMIKLHLPTQANLETVQQLPGLDKVTLDRRFGVVQISPQDGLYVVRTDSVPDVAALKQLCPEVLEVYGDVRIGTTNL